MGASLFTAPQGVIETRQETRWANPASPVPVPQVMKNDGDACATFDVLHPTATEPEGGDEFYEERIEFVRDGDKASVVLTIVSGHEGLLYANGERSTTIELGDAVFVGEECPVDPVDPVTPVDPETPDTGNPTKPETPSTETPDFENGAPKDTGSDKAKAGTDVKKGAVTGDPLAATGSGLPIGIAASAAALLGLGGLLVRRAALKKTAPSAE